MPKKYNFFCVICGTGFSPTKKHARCCSSECRVALSNIMRYEKEPEDAEQVKEEIDKGEVQKKFKDATGKNLHPNALSEHPEKPKEETTPTGKLLGKKKKGDPELTKEPKKEK